MGDMARVRLTKEIEGAGIAQNLAELGEWNAGGRCKVRIGDVLIERDVLSDVEMGYPMDAGYVNVLKSGQLRGCEPGNRGDVIQNL